MKNQSSLYGTVKIWDVENGHCLKTLEGHTKSVFFDFAAYTNDGKTIVTQSEDTKIWDAISGECKHMLKGNNYLN
jgi:WD40 repeat protein